jgi:hypothetical protein
MPSDDALLATHQMNKMSASCSRCGFSYQVIIASRLPCGEAPARSSRAGGRRWSSRAVPTKGRYGWIRAVVEPHIRDKIIEEATRQDVSISEIVRQACRAYIEDGTQAGWGAEDVREAIRRAAPRWTAKPVELEGWLLVFGLTPAMVEDIVAELSKPHVNEDR